jgi:imidazolonepropionase-like amidohydrolase
VREHINQGVTVIKLYADNRPNRTMLSIDEMRAVVTEAHRYNVRVTAHATFNQSIHNAVLAGVDGIEHGYNVSDSTLILMAKKHVFLVPTDGDRESMLKDNPNGTAMADRYFKRMADRLMRAIKAGVPIALGSDDYAESKNLYGEQSKHNLIGYHNDGVPIPQVLQIGTFNSAQQIGRSKDLGLLKKGFLADIIAVDENIETDIHAILNVRFVMKGGVIYKNTPMP